MKAWFYKLIGSDAEVPWEAGTDLPENVQLGNPDFLNQFIKRTNLRVAAMRMLGHTVSFAAEYGVGEAYLGSLWSRCSDAISGPGAFYWNTSGPAGEDDGDSCYAVHRGFSGPGPGDTSPQNWMRTLREAITARTNVVRKPYIYSWKDGTQYFGPAGQFISGLGVWFQNYEEVENPEVNWEFGDYFNYPYTPSNYLATMDGDLDALVPAGRYITWSDGYGGIFSRTSVSLLYAVANLVAPIKNIGFTVRAYGKGIRISGTTDYHSVEFPDEGVFYEKAAVARVTSDPSGTQSISLGCQFGLSDRDETVAGTGSGKYQILALLKIDIDESTTPD